MAIHPISIESAGGEYMESVVVVEWAAKPGDRVKKGDLVVTVETAKAATEVEAEHDGWLAGVFFEPGQEAPVGAVLGTIADSEADLAPSPDAPVMQPGAEVSVDAAREQSGEKVMAVPSATRVIASPLARRLARAAGLDLARLTGTGPNGRIKQRDVLAAIDATAREKPARVIEDVVVSTPAVLRGRPAPLVLLHGFGADRSAWRQVLPLLPSGIETLALDLPGHGTEGQRPATGIEDMALAISDRLEEAGLESVHLAGHSLGGATALALTALGRVSVRSVTLFAPGGLGPEINGGFIAGLTRSMTPEALERWLALMVGDKAPLPQGYARAVLRQMEKTGNREALERLGDTLFPDGTQVFDLGGALAALAVPTRIVWGRADRIIPPAHAARAPDFAAVHLLSGVGHVPQMEAPTLTARLIGETVLSAG